MNNMSLGLDLKWNGMALPFQVRTTPSEGVGKWEQLQQCEVTASTDAGWNRMCRKVNYLRGWRVLSASMYMAEKFPLYSYMPVSQFVVKKWCLSAYRCSVYEAVHLWKVGRFPAISAHLRKVGFRRCAHGTLSELLWLGFTFSTCLSTFGRWDDIAGKLRTFRR